MRWRQVFILFIAIELIRAVVRFVAKAVGGPVGNSWAEKYI